MNKKLITIVMLSFLCCFIAAGIFFKEIAEKNKRGSVTITGMMVNGKFRAVQHSSLGGDSEQYKMYNSAGDICYILSGIIGGIGVIALVCTNVKKVK